MPDDRNGVPPGPPSPFGRARGTNGVHRDEHVDLPTRSLAVDVAEGPADLVAVPSHNESFGLVALEAQACGTPVIATRVGGLTTTVRDGVSGLLVDGHSPDAWAAALRSGLQQRSLLSLGAVEHAAAPNGEANAGTEEKPAEHRNQELVLGENGK